jgi:hypothetical protein
MRTAVWGSILFTLLAVVPAFPDTVTKTDGLSLNGSLRQMSGGVITLEAQFKSGGAAPIYRTLYIKISDVESIEFNYGTFNPGAPPRAVADSPPPPAQSGQAALADKVVLKGGTIKTCKLIGIDQQLVHCAGNGGDYDRKVTFKILVGGH